MTDWLDDDEMQAWRGLVEVFSDVRASLEADLTELFGLTEGDYGVLVVLSEASGRRLRMCDLASRLHLTPGGLTRRLDGLVQKGFVIREPSTEDRRVVLAVLTDDGMAMLEKAAPEHVDSVRRHFFDHLTSEQVRDLGLVFEAVQAARVTEGQATT